MMTLISNRVTFRPVEFEDLAQARVLGRAFYDEAVCCHNVGYCEQKLINLLALACQKRDDLCFFVAEREGKLVGLLIGEAVEYFFSKQKYAVNDVFYVVPGFRGSPVAKGLLECYVDWAENSMCSDATLNTITGIETERAGKFFELMGFTRIGSIHKKEL